MAEHEQDEQGKQEGEAPARDDAEETAEDLAEAQPERKSSVVATVAAVVLLLIALAAAYWSWQKFLRPKPLASCQACSTQVGQAMQGKAPADRPGGALTEGTPETIPNESGNKDAKVKVEACLGHCISGLMKGFLACAKAWPDKIYVRYMPYESPEGQKFVQEHGHELACIVINGKDHFTVEDEQGKHEVDLIGPPGMTYTARDLVEILRQEMKKAYGEVPEDFDKTTAVFSDQLANPESQGP